MDEWKDTKNQNVAKRMNIPDKMLSWFCAMGPSSWTRRNGRDEIDERASHACLPRSQSRGARRSRVFDGGRRAADSLSPMTLRPLAGPHGLPPLACPPTITLCSPSRTRWAPGPPGCFPGSIMQRARRGEHHPGGGKPPSAPTQSVAAD